jgi:hypothetical protein
MHLILKKTIQSCYCINECLVYVLILSLIIDVSLSLSVVVSSETILILMVKTAVFVGQALVSTSAEINSNLAFTDNVKGLH